MKIIKLIFSIILLFAIVTAIFAGILYFKGNKEKTVLTDAERKGTAGQYVTLPKGVTHYQLGGPDTGKVVVLIHGFSVPYYIWDPTYDFLVKQGYRVLRYDMYGRGYSDRPDSAYNRFLYHSQLIYLLHQLHIRTPVTLMGVSFGGEVATTFTNKYPDLVDKVILVDPGYLPEDRSHLMFMASFHEATHGDERATGQLTDFKYPAKHPDWVTKYRVQMQYKGFRNALVSTLYDFDYNGREENTLLNNRHKPVLLIWGKEDHTVPFTYSDSVRSVLKCDFLPVDDACHLPHIEKADEVNAKLLEFLKK